MRRITISVFPVLATLALLVVASPSTARVRHTTSLKCAPAKSRVVLADTEAELYVLTVPHGFAYFDLHLEPDGRPVASWIDDEDTIRTVTGSLTGALGRPMRFQHIPKVSEVEVAQAQAVGFTHDDKGDTIFAYLTGGLGGPKKLMMMTSADGGPFSRPRQVASLPSETDETSLVAGGHRSLLVLWTHIQRNAEHFEGRRGNVFGNFDRQFQVDATPYFGVGVTTGFIDSYGRSVVIQRGPVAHHSEDFELDALPPS